jgi:hypothetical protein
MRLKYYTDLDDIAKLLHSSGETVCLHPLFLQYLSRIDDCLVFTAANVVYIPSFDLDDV